MNSESYILRSAHTEELQRLSEFSRIYDPGTHRFLREIGIRPDWQCLEAGAGTGTIAAWLASFVGIGGSVLATDTKPALLENAAKDHEFTAIYHDLTQDSLAENAYDLVHCRAVLEHLDSADQAFHSLAGATNAGGWLVIESHDLSPSSIDLVCRHTRSDLAPTVSKFLELGAQAMSRFGATPEYGSKLLHNFLDAGFIELTLETHAYPFAGGAESLFSLSLSQVEEALLGSGAMTQSEYEEALAVFNNPDSEFLTPLLVSVRGRAPTRS
ncbi:class I SAM-dependent methyltransferase [Streptomyces sp. NBC_01264]|uniref:class I SAM-dependent methyltransferase n=1 Tax=Streptomyces sp. NBC_01264 TaxID=2903804 RepID=UPI0022583058|nr:class I SAM-dependent methyltransferase [Streptomyces sp. NBC_01264]MCX4784546.1 methyltransferase domain-containing protein [Streptomyces sp. NBC_01264]